MPAEGRPGFNYFDIHVSTILKRIRHRSRVYISFAVHFLTLLNYERKRRRSNQDVRFIAVALVEHLGDMVACEPVARYVRQLHPGAPIVWLVSPQYSELVASNPNVDFFLMVHCLTEKDLLLHTSLFDHVFDLHFPERYCALCGPRPNRTISHGKIGLSNFYNYGNLLGTMSLSAGLPAIEDQPRVYISEDIRRRVDAEHLPSDFVAVHCLSNTVEKDWPRQNWERLSAHIMSTYGCAIVEVGLSPVLGKTENVLYKNLTGRLSILETAEVIRRAKLFVGIDSGPAHLANAVGTYGVVIMGSYLGFKTYNPFPGAYGNGKNASLIHVAGPVANAPVQKVIEMVDARLTARLQ
ncbi:MAG TPA: glycosyltransferase family 9 protein [Bacteroidota bacterium]|nr:glycosyltransferase family 9 protein [Bacteroidota bacterium]